MPIANWFVYYDETFYRKITRNDDGNVVLASAYGQYVAGIIGANMASAKEGATNYEKLITYTEGYKDLGIYALVAGLVLILISPFVKKLMQEVH